MFGHTATRIENQSFDKWFAIARGWSAGKSAVMINATYLQLEMMERLHRQDEEFHRLCGKMMGIKTHHYSYCTTKRRMR